VALSAVRVEHHFYLQSPGRARHFVERAGAAAPLAAIVFGGDGADIPVFVGAHPSTDAASLVVADSVVHARIARAFAISPNGQRASFVVVVAAVCALGEFAHSIHLRIYSAGFGGRGAGD